MGQLFEYVMTCAAALPPQATFPFCTSSVHDHYLSPLLVGKGLRYGNAVPSCSHVYLASVLRLIQVMVKGAATGRAATLLLRGANDYMLDEMDRSLHDALCTVKRVLESGAVVPGTGSKLQLEWRLPGLRLVTNHSKKRKFPIRALSLNFSDCKVQRTLGLADGYTELMA